MHMKLPPGDIKKLTELIALKLKQDKNGKSIDKNYLSGKDLVSLFNSLGFKDAYNNGIEAEGLPENCSRKDYTRNRLNQLNAQGMIHEAINAYLSFCEDKDFAEAKIEELSLGISTLSGQNKISVNIKDDNTKSPKMSKKTTQFAPPPSQLDNIPEGYPVVFISYAWDDEDHKKWVKKLADDLRSKGVYSLLDQYNPKGESLTKFMVNGIKVADRVLVIGSPRYKEKIDNPKDHSGVKFEDQILSIDLYHGIERKYIPLLRRGTFEESFGKLMSEKDGFDFRDDPKYDETLEDLVLELYGKPSTTPPPLGKPKFSLSSNTVNSPSNNNKVTSQIKNKDPFKGEKFLKSLLETFSFNLMDEYFHNMPERFDMRISDSFDAWEAIITSSVFIIHDKQLDDVIKEFFKDWYDITNLGLNYYEISNNHIDYHFYPLKGDIITDSKAEVCFNEMMKILHKMLKSYRAMTTYIKAEYPDIDLEDFSRKFEIEHSKI